MKINKSVVILLFAAAAGALFFFWFKSRGPVVEPPREVYPVYGEIQKFVTATATVQPQNRLEMKPPVAGRVDKILVEEGQLIKTGDIVAQMSSTERAALLDAARSQGAEQVAYWEGVYKPIPIIAPIDGQIIVKSVQPGQTVTATDPIVVLSDRLIVQAQVDETDIGKLKEGQKAVVSLDAYPDIQVDAVVSHIYYESQVVNNVTIYKVDVMPERTPAEFRSGMSASARVIQEDKKDILVIPQEAVKRGQKGEKGSFVLVSRGKNQKPERREVTLGISDDTQVEVVSGITDKDVLLIPAPKTAAKKGAKAAGSTNPFMPGGGQRRR